MPTKAVAVCEWLDQPKESILVDPGGRSIAEIKQNPSGGWSYEFMGRASLFIYQSRSAAKVAVAVRRAKKLLGVDSFN